MHMRAASDKHYLKKKLTALVRRRIHERSGTVASPYGVKKSMCQDDNLRILHVEFVVINKELTAKIEPKKCKRSW